MSKVRWWALGVGGALELERGIRQGSDVRLPMVAAGVWLGIGGFAAAVSTVRLLTPSYEENTYKTFIRNAALSPEPRRAERLYQWAECRLLAAADADRRHRIWRRWLGAFGAAVSAGGLAYELSRGDSPDHSPFTTAVYATGTALFGIAVVDTFFPTATERMAQVWTQDRTLAHPRATARLHLAPVIGPLGVGLTGSFW